MQTADGTQLSKDSNLCIQAITTTASKQNFRAGSRRACAYDGHAQAWRTSIDANTKDFVDVTLSKSMQQAICEHQGSAGVWIWAHLMSTRCVICYGGMSYAWPFCRPKIVFVLLLARCDLLGALGARADRQRRIVGDVISVHASLAVPCQSAAVQSRLPWQLHVVGGAWAEMGCGRCLVGFGPTAWNAVGSTLHLQQPDLQAAALRMVHRASGSVL